LTVGCSFSFSFLPLLFILAVEKQVH
jgi:hypothetical protein